MDICEKLEMQETSLLYLFVLTVVMFYEFRQFEDDLEVFQFYFQMSWEVLYVGGSLKNS